MTEPTDAELDAVLCSHWPAFSMQATLVRMWVRAAMRAAIAKFGTPPAVAGEPVAWMGTHDKTDLYYRKPPQADVVPLYATPQPTQAQAGAVPLTDEQVNAIDRRTLGYLHFARAIEHAHGIGIKDGDSHA